MMDVLAVTTAKRHSILEAVQRAARRCRDWQNSSHPVRPYQDWAITQSSGRKAQAGILTLRGDSVAVTRPEQELFPVPVEAN